MKSDLLSLTASWELYHVPHEWRPKRGCSDFGVLSGFAGPIAYPTAISVRATTSAATFRAAPPHD
jgi:hypothetical protein